MRTLRVLLLLLAPAGCVFFPGDGSGGDGWPEETDTSDGVDSGGAGVEDGDGDGVSAERDCDDQDEDVFPGAPERCNGLDDDCDGRVDDGCEDDSG